MVIGIAGLINEMIDYAVEKQSVVDALAAQQLYSGHSFGRQLRPHRDHNSPLAGIDYQGCLRVERTPDRSRGRGGHEGGAQETQDPTGWRAAARPTNGEVDPRFHRRGAFRYIR
jgi:hypothetical protein